VMQGAITSCPRPAVHPSALVVGQSSLEAY
jgi:hypothetical protein